MSSPDCGRLCPDLARAEAVRRRMQDEPAATVVAERERVSPNPVRLRVASALALGGELCVCDVAWVCVVPRELALRCVGDLRSMGFAAARRDGQLVIHRLTPLGRLVVAALLSSDDETGPTIVPPRQADEW